MAKVAVIGAGAMGLAAAYHALGEGHAVTLYEADTVAGGMAAHFDFDGLSIERFYHFVCKADAPTFALMQELGVADRMRWRATSMGYYIDGRHYDWGDPLSLLAFPRLDPLSKLRYGAQMFLTTRRKRFDDLEHVRARDWFVGGAGQKVYDLLWRRLLELKFFDDADNISAAWLATRVKRVGTSRRSMMQEELGYIEGGSQTLVDALTRAIEARGGEIRLGAPAQEIVSVDGRVAGVRVGGEVHGCDAVLCTVPTPLVPRLAPGLDAATRARYEAIRNIGVVCVLLKLRKSVTKHFWLNVNDPRIDIPGLVEFSNLRPAPDTIVYVPYYMPLTHPKFGRDDKAFVDEAFGYLRLLNPALGDGDLIAAHVGRLRHAQPICEPGFLAKIPKVVTPIQGLQIADTCFYYPEDRGVAESVRYGKLMAAAVTRPHLWDAEGR